MTTENTTTETVDTPEAAAEETATEQLDQSKGNKEAAKYRTRLREVEAERDNAAARVNQLSTKLIEHNLPKHLPAKLFWHDNKQQDFYDQEGNLDHELLQVKITETVKAYGIKSGPYVPAMRGKQGGSDDAKKSFDSSFAPKKSE